MTELLTSAALENLARQPLPAFFVDDEHADQIAHLALLITQVNARVLPAGVARPFHDRTQNERDAMRMGVYRVIQALVLLGWIEPPA